MLLRTVETLVSELASFGGKFGETGTSSPSFVGDDPAYPELFDKISIGVLTTDNPSERISIDANTHLARKGPRGYQDPPSSISGGFSDLSPDDVEREPKDELSINQEGEPTSENEATTKQE